MKEAAKAFLVIIALLLGAFLVYDGGISQYTNHDTAKAIDGLILLAAGLTAVWLRYGRPISK